MRWVLARGRFERRADGHVYGRGIVIDITDSRIDGPSSRRSAFSGPRPSRTAVERMGITRCACGSWSAISAREATRVQPLLEALLYELGRQIAASLSGEPPDAARRPRNPRAH